MKPLLQLTLTLLAIGGLVGCASSPLTSEEAPIASKIGAMTLDLGGGIDMVFMPIPAGSFLMGSPETQPNRKVDESPQVEVTITRPYMMGTTEVTVGQFRRFVEATGYKTKSEVLGWSHAYTTDAEVEEKGRYWDNPGVPQTENHPVTCLAWEDLQGFLDWLSTTQNVTARLPTEAEWEYACRAGTSTAYSWGDNLHDSIHYGNLADVSAMAVQPTWNPPDVPHDDGYPTTAPVAQFRPNPWGLYDMHGNVWEWCADWYGPYTSDAKVDPTGPEPTELRTRRGGSWYYGLGTSRSTNRGKSEPNFRVNNRGFRVALSLPTNFPNP